MADKVFKDILLPVDLGHPETQKRAISVAIAQARCFDSRLHVMTIMPDFGMSIVGSYFPEGYEEKMLEEANTRLNDFVQANLPEDLEVQSIVAHGRIYEEILRYAHRDDLQIDLVIMASHQPELSDYLMGPNAAKVARHSRCSVLIIRG